MKQHVLDFQLLKSSRRLPPRARRAKEPSTGAEAQGTRKEKQISPSGATPVQTRRTEALLGFRLASSLHEKKETPGAAPGVGSVGLTGGRAAI
jgi:hypothetical protein